MDEHPQDSIPAFVLGTLDVDEALLVSAHIMRCPPCREEVEAFHALLDTLPYLATPQHPPPHVKRQLFARISATAGAFELAAPAPIHPHQPLRWPIAVTAGAVALSLVFAVLLLNQLSANNAQFQQNQQTLSHMQILIDQNQQALTRLHDQHDHDQQTLLQLHDQLTQDQHIAMFIAAPQTRHRMLNSADRRASATMYMQPGSAQAVLVIEGMVALDPGQTYQFWLANQHGSISCITFNVTSDGRAVLMIKAPAPVPQYDQAMVTVEPRGGAAKPSDKVVLSGPLSAVRPVIVALGGL